MASIISSILNAIRTSEQQEPQHDHVKQEPLPKVYYHNGSIKLVTSELGSINWKDEFAKPKYKQARDAMVAAVPKRTLTAEEVEELMQDMQELAMYTKRQWQIVHQQVIEWQLNEILASASTSLSTTVSESFVVLSSSFKFALQKNTSSAPEVAVLAGVLVAVAVRFCVVSQAVIATGPSEVALNCLVTQLAQRPPVELAEPDPSSVVKLEPELYAQAGVFPSGKVVLDPPNRKQPIKIFLGTVRLSTIVADAASTVVVLPSTQVVHNNGYLENVLRETEKLLTRSKKRPSSTPIPEILAKCTETTQELTMGAYASDEDAVIVDSSHDSEPDIVRPGRVMGLVEQLPEDFQEMTIGEGATGSGRVLKAQGGQTSFRTAFDGFFELFN
ncbi:hypothetical protein GGX14DRAFT_388962 [Mycena pura]|uniref:Uncharacterized protein n=1 Tax=Mycena pura TaxID=153505 RepID=A0AAD6YJZ2_9AGAR|nr:hypothetical protein GGX14DRAFT_388962 [Mycena pura]